MKYKNYLPLLAFTISSISANAQRISPTTNMSTKRIGHQAQSLGNGKVLVFGGNTTSPTFQPVVHASCEIYDSVTKAWTPAANMVQARTNHQSVVTQSGKILAIGGDSASTVNRLNVESYDPVTNTWAVVGTLNKPRKGGEAILLDNGQVLVASSYPSSIEVGPADGSGLWTEHAVPASYRIPESPRMIRMNDSRILVIGSYPAISTNVGVIITQSLSIDTATNRMAEDHPSAGLALLSNGKVLVTGGTASGANELFDPATNTFASAALFNNSHLNTPLMKLTDGRVAVSVLGVAGGAGGDKEILEIYNPVTNSWQIVPSHQFYATNSYSATYLGNGKYLMSGGAEYMQLVSTGTMQCFIFDEFASTMGIVDNKQLKAKMFYNASQRSFHIKLLQESGELHKVNLYNSSGRLITSYTFSEKQAQLDLPDISPGLYIIRVTNQENGQTGSCKFFK